MKLTKSEIEEIIFLKNKDTPTKEICEKFKVWKGTIYWHTNPLYRERLRKYQRKKYSELTIDQKKKLQEKKRPYQRIYHKNRYNTDEVFKEKQKNYSKKK